MSKIEVPVWEKVNITIEEAAALFSIGEDVLRKMTKSPSCTYVLHKGSHKLIKRKQFEKYLEGITTL